MRAVIFLVLLAAPSLARAEECSPPRLLNQVQMSHAGHGEVDLIPVAVNGTAENFIFDTGGFASQIGPAAAAALHLPVRPGNRELYDMRGVVSRDEAQADSFTLGQVTLTHVALALSPNVGAFDGSPIDGILALDMLANDDADLDFGADTLKLFSEDHCPGAGVTWKPPAIAVAPITLARNHITVPVMLDGHAFQAVIDSGASDTALTEAAAKRIFGLTPGDAATPRYGELNGDPALPTYIHWFKNLTFGQVSVGEPGVLVIPDSSGLGDKSRDAARETLAVPDLILGMDVLRNLHIYLAMGEGKIYVTPASQPVPK
jgi:predicted aspartyl protease